MKTNTQLLTYFLFVYYAPHIFLSGLAYFFLRQPPWAINKG